MYKYRTPRPIYKIPTTIISEQGEPQHHFFQYIVAKTEETTVIQLAQTHRPGTKEAVRNQHYITIIKSQPEIIRIQTELRS